MRPKLQFIPIHRDELELAGRIETPIMKAQRIIIGKSNYPIPICWDWELSRKRSAGVVHFVIDFAFEVKNIIREIIYENYPCRLQYRLRSYSGA